jgi:hypothetical protein
MQLLVDWWRDEQLEQRLERRRRQRGHHWLQQRQLQRQQQRQLQWQQQRQLERQLQR